VHACVQRWLSALGPRPSALCPMPHSPCPLSSALCPLLSALGLLPSALCPLPSALCPLPSALCVLAPGRPSASSRPLVTQPVLVPALLAFLQGLDWHNDPEIMKSIISFYTKVWTAALVIFRGLRSPVQAVPAPLSHSTLPYTPSPHPPSRRARTSSWLASMTRVPRWRSTSTGTTRRCAGLRCVPPCEPQPHSAKPRVPGSARIPLSGELLFLDPPPPPCSTSRACDYVVYTCSEVDCTDAPSWRVCCCCCPHGQALGALRESAKYAGKVSGGEGSSTLMTLNQRIAVIERFVQARKMVSC
jgi:hypothetical protein